MSALVTEVWFVVTHAITIAISRLHYQKVESTTWSYLLQLMPALVAEMWSQSVQCEMFQAEGESAVQVVM